MSAMRKFKVWSENTVDSRGQLIQAKPFDVEADDWTFESGALVFRRGERNWMIIAPGSWAALRDADAAEVVP